MQSQRHWNAAAPPAGAPCRAALLAIALLLAVSAVGRAQTVQNPRRLAEGPPGQLLVAARSAGAIVAIDRASLQPVWSYVLSDEGAPFGLATWNRLVFVGNTVTRAAEVYRMVGSRGGRTTLRFEYNLGSAPIEKPVSIAVDRREQLVFVLDAAEKQVKIFERGGAPVHAFEPRDVDGELLSPVSVAVDEAQREVLVGDYGDPSGFFRARRPARILIYDYEGVLLFQIDGNGTTHESTKFARVQGMAASGDGRIFATEPLASRLLVIDRASGALLGEVGTEGFGPGELMLPLDVYREARSGDLFVSNNRGARRIEVFRGAGR